LLVVKARLPFFEEKEARPCTKFKIEEVYGNGDVWPFKLNLKGDLKTEVSERASNARKMAPTLQSHH